MSRKLSLGLIVSLQEDVLASLKRVAGLGLRTCQLACWKPALLSDDLARRVREASDQTGVTISSFWAGYSGPARWNFTEGPSTIGLVPQAYRKQRVNELLAAITFARAIGVESVTTHVGFIPEDPADPAYRPLLDALRIVVGRCREFGRTFCFETGQETPVALLRAIEDLDADNLGVNLDPANLILYGKANPVDALEVIGPYIRGVHAKDGRYPTNGRELGQETPLGQGKVDFPALIKALKKHGYHGPLTIEREIRGPQQQRDIETAIAYLTPLL